MEVDHNSTYNRLIEFITNESPLIQLDNFDLDNIKKLLRIKPYDKTEGRKFLRIVDTLPLSLKLDKTATSATVINLSEKGLCFKDNNDYNFKLLYGNIDKIYPPIKAEIEIIWKKYINNQWVYGVSFKKGSIKDNEVIRNIIWRRESAVNVFKEALNRYLEYLQDIEDLIKKGITLDKKILNRADKNNEFILLVAELLEQTIYSKTLRKDLQNYFRICVGRFVYQGKIFKHMFEKPHGYPGDFKLFDMFYRNEILSQEIGAYFDRFVLEYPLSRAITNRKNLIKNILKEIIVNSSVPTLDILNLGCGLSKELEELFTEYIPDKKLDITCVDWDKQALEIARERTNFISSNIKIEFINRDIQDLIDLKKDDENICRQRDVVYSIAFANYLKDRVLSEYLKVLWGLVKPGGKLILSYMNQQCYQSHLQIKWFADWKINIRNEETILDLVESTLNDYTIEVIWEETKHLFIIVLTKEQNR